MAATLEHKLTIVEHAEDGSTPILENWSETFIGGYGKSESFVSELEVDNTDTFTTVANFNPSARVAQNLASADIVWIHNTGPQPAEIQIQYATITAGSPDVDAATQANVCTILGGNRWMTLPGIHAVHYSSTNSAANGDSTTVSNISAPSNNRYQPSTDMDVNDAGNVSATDNPVEFEVTDSDWFVPGDYIRIDDEIMQVHSIEASNHIKCTRGHFGSAMVAHSDNDEIYYFTGNHLEDWEFGSTTNASGSYKGSTFFGYGRNGDANKDFWGLVPGSVAIRFYGEGGYQRFGMNGVSPGEKSGLSASTAYAFDVAIDGGSADTIAFTTDSVNTNWGAKNGVLDKINQVFKENYYTNGKNMINKKVSIGIVDGDIQVTSHSNLSTTAVALATASSGTNIFSGSLGRIPATAALMAGKSKYPADQKMAKGIQTKNNADYHIYDDGNGNLYFGEGFTGQGQTNCGTIDYYTGAWHITGALPNAEFTIYATVNSGLSGPGGICQILKKISARSTSTLANATIKVRAMDASSWSGSSSTGGGGY